MLVAMSDQINDESRAAIVGSEEENQRQRKICEWQEQRYMYNRAISDYLEQQDRQTTALGWREWQLQQSYSSQMMEWEGQQRRRDHELWERYEQSEDTSFRESLPPNWNSPEIDFPGLEELEKLQLKEGLPLAWVPPNRVLGELLSCKTTASRAKVIARESKVIVSACLRELRRLRSTESREWRASAREAALAMEAGHWRAGQALAAIALDTAVAKFVRSSYSGATRHYNKKREPTPPGSSEGSLPTWYDVDYPRALLVLHSLFGAFSVYDGNGGEPVPTQFTRHGTVHSISRRQYSKANALIALMHLVGLLCLIEDE